MKPEDCQAKLPEKRDYGIGSIAYAAIEAGYARTWAEVAEVAADRVNTYQQETNQDLRLI